MSSSYEEIHPKPSERSPLLLRGQSTLTTGTSASRRSLKQRRKRRIGLWLMFVILLTSLGDQFMDSPQTRIFESVICYRYYERVDPSKIAIPRSRVGPGAVGGVEEMWCKVDEVQSDLALLRAGQQSFDGVPSLALALPVGWAADRYGRKPLLLAGFFGFALSSAWKEIVAWFWQSFPIRAVWFSTLFASVGGGSAMTTTLVFVVLSDVTPEAERGSVFLRVGAFNLVANLVMPPLAAWIMPYSPWIPAIGGTVLQLAAAIFCAFIPETLHAHGGRGQRPGHSRTNTATSIQSNPPPPPDPAPTTSPISLNQANQWLENLRNSTSFLTTDWRIPLLITTFLGHTLFATSPQLIVQYLSARYNLTLAYSTLVLTIRSAMIVTMFTLILPLLSKLLVDYLHLPHPRKDLLLSRASWISLALGWTIFGLAWNIPFAAFSLVIASLGQGAPILVRSFLTSLLAKDQIAKAYSVISVVDTLGMIVGAPMLAGLLKRGLGMGEGWVGLPWYVVGAVSGLFAVVLLCVGVGKGEGGDDSSSEEEEQQQQQQERT